MTHRGWLLGVFVLLISASFAGCLGDDDSPDTADTTTDDADTNDDGTTDGNETADDGADDTGDNDTDAARAPPIASIAVAGNSTVAPEEEVAFDASGTVDNDTLAENLTFSWDFGDGGSAEGVNVTHAFAAEGNFTVVLSVTDPEGNSGTANTTIVVVSAFADTVVTELTGSITAPNPVVHNAGPAYGSMNALPPCATQLECYKAVGGVEDTHFVLHAIEIPAGAAAVVLESAGVSDTASLQFAAFSADGKRIGSAPIGMGTSDQKLVLLQPDQWAGGITVFVSSPGAPSSSYSITVTALAEAP